MDQIPIIVKQYIQLDKSTCSNIHLFDLNNIDQKTIALCFKNYYVTFSENNFFYQMN